LKPEEGKWTKITTHRVATKFYPGIRNGRAPVQLVVGGEGRKREGQITGPFIPSRRN